MDEITRQHRASRLVERMVWCNVGGLVSLLEESESSDWQEWRDEAESNAVSLGICIECQLPDFLDNHPECRGYDNISVDEDGTITVSVGEDSLEYLYEIDPAYVGSNGCCRKCSPVEVFEWYAIDPWLAARLTERGHIIVDTGMLKIWGRECTGQAVLLDDDIQEIACGLEWTNWMTIFRKKEKK